MFYRPSQDIKDMITEIKKPSLVKSPALVPSKPLITGSVSSDYNTTPSHSTIGQYTGRDEAIQIIMQKDNRLLAICGPRSIHDPVTAVEYARRLKELSDKLSRDLFITTHAYLEEPRTRIDWAGLINDPNTDNNFDINKGLRISRSPLTDRKDRNMPLGFELLDSITPQYYGDVMSWGPTGSRTTESQLHRELANGRSFPVDFKNGTDGSLQVAADGVQSVTAPHHSMRITKQDLAAIKKTSRNEYSFMILRGDNGRTNFDQKSVQKTKEVLQKENREEIIMIDCSYCTFSLTIQ